MKKTILATTLLLASISQADIITCYFTEPFTTSVYSMSKSTLSYKENVMGGTSVIKNVSFQIKSAGVFELVSKEGKVIQTLNLNNKGSDGMSDTTYPFDVKDNDSMTNQGYGGCQSNSLKATK